MYREHSIQRILVVGDDPFLRDLVRWSLAGLPAEVHTARSEALVRRCRGTAFDLVILLGCGPLLCGALCRGGEGGVADLHPDGVRRPAVYLLSWQQGEQCVVGMLEAGIDQYMTFPISLHRLRAKAAAELENRC